MSDAQVLTMAEFFAFGPGDWSPDSLSPSTSGSGPG
jgi:hypothetical protein